MCAIAATLDLKNHTIFSQVFSLLKHRGPDESAIVDEGWVQLGCHRLAIVDPDGGAQPLRSADNRWLLVFNGEIYNFHLLREKFSNYPFRTQTDGEILFPLIEREGPAGLNQLRGMFTFVLVNLTTREFLAARDPFGIKPLYFLRIDAGLTIASELKSFASLAGRPRFVPPGHFITRKGLERYYRIPSRKWFPRLLPVRQILQEAIERHVPSNGPYGVLLSGGLDSSIVAALATRFNPNLTAYTVSMPGAVDEIAASELAKELKIHHTVLHVSRDEVVAALPMVIRHLESFNPVMVRNAVPLYLLAQKARNDVKVLLSGDGADELFAGYDYLSSLPQRFWPEAIESGFNNLHRTELQRVDRMTMAHGVELRVPFLDTRLVETAINLPISEKIRRVKGRQISKWVLRQAVADLLPPEICWRDKVPFAEGSGVGEFTWDRQVDRTSNLISGWECSDDETLNYLKLWKKQFPEVSADIPIWADAARYTNFVEEYGHSLLGLFRQ